MNKQWIIIIFGLPIIAGSLTILFVPIEKSLKRVVLLVEILAILVLGFIFWFTAIP